MSVPSSRRVFPSEGPISSGEELTMFHACSETTAQITSQSHHMAAGSTSKSVVVHGWINSLPLGLLK